MTKQQVLGILWVGAVLAGLWHFSKVPPKPGYVLQAEVVHLEDVPGGNGLRRITVRFEDGEERVIETLTPFFFKPGYSANVGVYERTLFADVYDIVNGSND